MLVLSIFSRLSASVFKKNISLLICTDLERLKLILCYYLIGDAGKWETEYLNAAPQFFDNEEYT